MQMKVPKRKTKQGIINGAIKLLSDEKNWTQGADAETAKGYVVDIDSPSAVKYCVRGGIRKCSADKRLTEQILKCINDIAIKTYGRSMIGVNDSLGYEAAMNLLNKSKKVCK